MILAASGLTPMTFLAGLLHFAVGMVIAHFASMGIGRLLARRATPHHSLVARRVTYYVLVGLAIASALGALGVDLGVLLGAAGILTVAIGFASQTSASNMISGLFMMGEQPFVVGDIIRVGGTQGTTGEVLSIDLLSVKLRTFDNLFVRVPNETLLKSEIVNLTRFPIRRIDMKLTVAYKEDVGRVGQVLMEVAEKNVLCLDEPKPLFLVKGFGESGLQLEFLCWASRENFLEVRNRLYEEINEAFERHGIEMPYPHRVVRVVAPDSDSS